MQYAMHEAITAAAARAGAASVLCVPAIVLGADGQCEN